MTQQPTLGSRLRRARLGSGLSQEEVARRSGLSVRALRDIEQDRVRHPRPASVERLLAALDLDPVGHVGPAAGRVAGSEPRDSSVPGPAPAQPGDSAPTVEVLGPLRLMRAGACFEVRGSVSRAVLGLTALRAGRLVTRDEIVEALWGEDPPPSWASQVHAAVGRVRALLDPDRERRASSSLLRLEPGGYALHLDREAVDLHRFNAAVEKSQTQPDDAALITLDHALRLWRGPVLAIEPAGVRDHAVALAATGRRIEAATRLADFAVRLGRPGLAIEHLQPLTREEPYHEGLHARLMTALAVHGDQAAALTVFASIRRRLIDQLGVEPGPELRQAQTRVLRGEAVADGPAAAVTAERAPWVVPRSLPVDLHDFTGREDELARLERLGAAETPEGVRRPLAAVVGMGGVGKTALVIRAAHRLADSYPDGQLYVNLRGADAAPLEAADVLARFLRATGVDPPAIPQDAAAREDLYRSRTASRRLLVVLDNAASAAQVRALLPGGSGCAVLLSARTRMPALEGARWIDLDVLPPERSVALLGQIVGEARIAAEPHASSEIARLCGNLPLAVRIVGARLAARPGRPLSHMAGLLRHERHRLDQLAVGDLEVRASLELSYRDLGAVAQRLFRLLGRLAVPDLPARVAAAILELPAEVAAGSLGELVDANLIVESGPDGAGQLRYRFHDLVRLYAREQAGNEDAGEVAASAVRRAFGSWLALAERFAFAVPGPCFAPLAGTSERPVLGDEGVLGAVDPLTWFDIEHPALRAAVSQACREGLHELAFELAGSLEKYFDLRGMYEEWRATNESVMGICRDAGNLLGEAVMLRGLIDVRTWNTVQLEGTAMGRSLHDARRLLAMFEELDEPRGVCDASVALVWGLCAAAEFPAAAVAAQRALDLAEQTGHVGGQARAHVAVALVCSETADGAGVLEHLDRALAAARRLGNPRYEASVLQFLGIACRELGDLERSQHVLDLSLQISRRLRDRYTEVLTLLSLARLHLRTGDPQARAEAESSLQLGREFTMPHHVAEALTVLGQLALAEGDPAGALEYLEESVAWWRTRGWPKFLAEALVACGAALAATGDDTAASRCGDEAADLFDSLGESEQAGRARRLSVLR